MLHTEHLGRMERTMTQELETFKIKVEKYKELMSEVNKQASSITCFLSAWHDSLYPDDMSTSELDERKKPLDEDDYWKCSDVWHEVDLDPKIGKLTKFLDE